MIIFSHQNPSLVAGTLASASGPLLDLLNVCCDHDCSMYESWKSASKTAEIWSNNQKTHVHMSLESSKRNGIHVDQLHNEVSFSMGYMTDSCPKWWLIAELSTTKPCKKTRTWLKWSKTHFLSGLRRLQDSKLPSMSGLHHMMIHQAMSLQVKYYTVMSFQLSLSQDNSFWYYVAVSYNWCVWYVTDAGLPVPSAQKTVTRRRRKQKARRKPYTPRKKKLDVVAGAAAATGGHDQTLQQVLIHLALCRLRLFGMFLDSSRTSSSRQCLISSGRADGFLASWHCGFSLQLNPTWVQS